MVEGGSLENCCAERYRGFESYFLRQTEPVNSCNWQALSVCGSGMRPRDAVLGRKFCGFIAARLNQSPFVIISPCVNQMSTICSLR